MHHPHESERGFTLIEILVAITILLVGVLGVTAMVDASNQVSVAANSRQGATNLMRRVVETTRALPYRSVKNASLAADVQAQSPDLATTTPGSWTVARDGYVYTLDASVCRVDDDSDGFGVHDTVDPAFCSDSTTTGTADGSPGDYKRVTVNATWTVRGKTRTVRQVTLLPPGGTGDAPTVASLQPRSGTAGQPLVITSQTPTTYTFDATTTNKPSYMSWLIDGTPNQTCPPITSTCGGSLNSWFFTWDIGAPTIDNTSGSPNLGKCISPVGSSSYVYDGTYQVWAQPLDSNGLAGSASSTPVTINRCVPIPPPNFNVTGQEPAYNGPVDVEWNDNPEGDVVGYKVFRGTSLSNFTPICPASATAAPIAEMNTCIDPTPPAHQPGVPIYYAAIAYDQDQTGAIRAGALAYLDSESPTNKAPKAPTNLTATASGGTVTVTWTIPATPLDPDTGDTIASYRVYRRLPPTPTTTPWTYQDRLSYQRPPDDGYDSVTAFCNGSTTSGTVCSYTDTNPGGVVHQYTVKSVDTHLRESNVPGGAVPTA